MWLFHKCWFAISFFLIKNGAEFIKVIYCYRQQRNFEQKNQHLLVLFHHFQCPISLISSPWIWWCAANLHCCKATNKIMNRTFLWTSSFQTFFLEAPEQSACCSLRDSGLFCLSLPCCTCVCAHRTQLRTGNAQRQEVLCCLWKKEGTWNCHFSKGQWGVSLRGCWLLPLFSPQSFAIHGLSYLRRVALGRTCSVKGHPCLCASGQCWRLLRLTAAVTEKGISADVVWQLLFKSRRTLCHFSVLLWHVHNGYFVEFISYSLSEHLELQVLEINWSEHFTSALAGLRNPHYCLGS